MEKDWIRPISNEHIKIPVFSRRTNSDGSFRLGRSLVYSLAFLVGVLILAEGYASIQRARDEEIAKSVLMINNARKNSDHLEPGQKFYERVTVVGAGRTLVEKWAMELRRGSVDVREGPSVDRQIIGTVKVGETISNVVLDINTNWAIAKCSDISNVRLNLSEKTSKICVVNGNYLLAIR